MPRRTFTNHSPCPVCGVDADFTLDIGTESRDAHIKFSGHTGPKGENVVCSQMIILRGQDGWTAWAEWMTDKKRHAEGWE